jgi:ABC-2 type transport system permease protein
MKKVDIIQWVVITAVLIAVNLVAAYLPARIDLTEEKRFTMTAATEKILAKVDDPVFVEVLLEGEFPAGFKRLRDETEEMLRDFSNINGEIEYGFTDPNDGTIAEVNENRKVLSDKGIKPINFQVQEKGGRSDKLLYPYAIVSYKSRTALINLLENNIPGQSPDVAVNNSISLLEYKFANAVQKLLRTQRPLIAYVEGHGELNELQTRDLSNSLAPYYNIGRLRLDTMPPFGPEQIGALLIAKPRGPYNDREKFLLDQYIMRGGRVIWMLDRLQVNLDSLQGRGAFIPNDYELNLDDILFKYGIRIEPNLVLDVQSTQVPIVVGQLGNAPQFELRPWPYHVLANPNPSHPITKSLQPVNLFFPSEIDTTVRTKYPIKRHVLLSSTKNALVRFSPVRVNLEDARYEPELERYNKGPFPIAVLMEGKFASLYENRVGSGFLNSLKSIGQEYRSESVETRMIVIADGDIAKNQINPEQGAFKPLGLNPFEQYVFDNKSFMLNALEYLFDESGVISARNREVKLRLLDGTRAREEKTFWQALNVGLPLLILGLFGLGYNYLRRRRYARS